MSSLSLAGVRFVRDGRAILDGIAWEVQPGERWVVLGPNGSGKTTLVRIASMWEHPTSGRVEVGGAVLGQVDVRSHRAQIAVVSAAVANLLRPGITAREIVLTARTGALEAWWHTYDDADEDRTTAALARLDAAHLADHPFATLSSGERQRVLLARALSVEPLLLLLDEPFAGLDLGAREELVDHVAALAADPATPPIVLVTHHVDEIPPAFTHALLLAEGRVQQRGPLREVLTAESISRTFGRPLLLEERHGRWYSVGAVGQEGEQPGA